jgi:hypothetical protein
VVVEHPLLVASGSDTFDTADVAVDADEVFGIVGLLPLEVDGFEVSGFAEEFVGFTEGPGAVPKFGAGIFWQFGGSYASKEIFY